MDDDLFETYSSTVDFIQAYVFPGGMLIKSSELRALAEARGLVWHEQTSFGGDYAKTLAVWRKSFDRAVEEARLPNGFDDSFIRFWRFYLSYCEGGFQAGTIDVHQVTLIKN
jgi:cyclopropane-fatty-acyl-phospholipid synthase